MKIIRISEKDRDLWDQAILTFPTAHPLNAYGWGVVRRIDGWRPLYLIFYADLQPVGALMLLRKRLPLSPFSILYSPRGPLIHPDYPQVLKEIVKYIKNYGKTHNAIFLRIDPNITQIRYYKQRALKFPKPFIHLKHDWTFWNTPKDVFRVDLTNKKNSHDLFLSLKKDCRRCVRKAQKNGITIHFAESKNDIDSFYKIFREFSLEKGFMARSHQYQWTLWQQYIKRGNGFLLLAKKDDCIVGGSLCLIFGDKCLGMHGAVPMRFRKYNTNELLEWESIKFAFESNCIYYSFRGKGPTLSQDRFKKKFNPELVSLIGYFDLPLMPYLYRIFFLGEFTVLPNIWPYIINTRKFLSKLIK